MWLSKKIGEKEYNSGAVTGMVGGSEDVRLSTVSVDGSGACTMVSLPGIITVPSKNDQVVVLNTTDGPVCLGVRLPFYDGDIQPGEIILRSGGGAEIKLANDGKVYINGEEAVYGS